MNSIVTLQLSIVPTLYSSISQSICPGQSYNGYTLSGTYIDTFLTATGCDSIRTLQLNVLTSPIPSLGSDKELCPGDSLTLNPGSFNSYLWQDGSVSSSLVVKTPGLYSVTVSNDCIMASDDILIKEKMCGIYFPSAFTPNNDGKNDLFKILGAFNLKDYHLVVYNRWGQKVFETNDYTKGWSGMIKGKLQNTEAFVWYCEFKKPGNINKLKMKGTVMLIN